MSAASPNSILPTLPILPIVDPATGLPTASELAWRNSIQYRIGGLNNPPLNNYVLQSDLNGQYALLTGAAFTGPVSATVFNGSGAGLNGTAANFTAGYATVLTGSTQTVAAEWTNKQYFSDGIVFPSAAGFGAMVNAANPTFPFRDIIGNIYAKGSGAYNPTWGSFEGAQYAYQFTVGDEVWITFHVPHDYVPGTDIFIHAHWAHNSALVTGGTITWTWNATYAKGFGQGASSAFPADITVSATQTVSPTTQYEQFVTEVKLSINGTVAGNALEPDGIILIHCYLSANNITVSSGSVPEPFLFTSDIHYQSSNIGTKNKAPNFYT